MPARSANCTRAKGGHQMTNDLQRLTHTRWNCIYHIVSAPKYRRMVFYGEKMRETGKRLRQLCEWKGAEIHKGRDMSGLYPYFTKHTAKDSCTGVPCHCTMTALNSRAADSNDLIPSKHPGTDRTLSSRKCLFRHCQSTGS